MMNGGVYWPEAFMIVSSAIDVTLLRPTSLYNFVLLFIASMRYMVLVRLRRGGGAGEVTEARLYA